jgi:hypothetical protein
LPVRLATLSWVLRRTTTETVIFVPDGAIFSPAVGTKGALALPGRTFRGEIFSGLDFFEVAFWGADFFFAVMRFSNLGMNCERSRANLRETIVCQC